jgi:AcrR family transcriptional regulator
MLYEHSEHRDIRRRAQRRELLQRAAQILSNDGRTKLSLRNVASSCDMSTQMVYTLFGGKKGLLEALHREGFRRMGQALPEPHQQDAESAFEELALAFRRFALSDPNLYSAMFGLNSQGFRPREAGVERETTAYRALESIVRRKVESNARPPECVRRVTDALWAVVHGAIAMEVAGYHRDDRQAEQNFVFACRAAFKGVFNDEEHTDTG